MSSLRGQCCIVFGASSGIGRAIAQALAREGASVGLVSRNLDALQAVAADIRQAGGEARAIAGSVTDADAVRSAVDLVVAAYGPPGILVNSAGTNVASRRLDVLSRDDWQGVLDTNLTGALLTIQAVLPHMRAQANGLIIQIASVSGRWPDGSGVAYQASKHGVVGLCEATMLEERSHGIRVSAILPGLVDTPMPMRRPQPPPRSLLDRALHPEDVAAACMFLAQLPTRCYIPELVILPPALQIIGQTGI